MALQVVILGAGITGSLTAWRLARAGYKVTVLEAQYPGAGSSSRTAAGIRQQYSTRETVLGMRFAVSFYWHFMEEVGGETTPIVQNGYLFLYNLEEAWTLAQKRVRFQQSWGLKEVEALPSEELVKRFPWVDPLTVLGGSWCPSDGFLRPDIVYQEACLAAQRLGATLIQRAPVVGVQKQGERIEAIVTPKGIFSGDIFIDATNAWSPRLAQTLQATILPVSPLKRYLWMVERAGSLDEAAFLKMPLVIAPGGAYCRPENAGSLLMGWAHNATPEPEFSYEDQDRIEPHFYHTSGPDSAGYESWASLAEVMPPLGEFAGLTATTSGYYATTPDHNPFLDIDPLVPNLIRLVGFSGHGAMFGPFTARVAEHLVGGGKGSLLKLAEGEVGLECFAIGRDFSHSEHLVI
jgi:glycine/D-amino acid oxidase-like deaminating enzyme